MKIWISDKQIIMSGKAWEVKAKLKQYGNQYLYVKDWLQGRPTNKMTESPPSITIKEDKL